MRLIDADELILEIFNLRNCSNGYSDVYDKSCIIGIIEGQQTVEPEPYKEKLNEIASDLSEKFAYMNTCPNERDIILGYLGVKRPCEAHCNTDCTNTKCESHPSSAQSDRSLWFRIGEICVDESKGIISADSAVEKIRELLREAGRRTDG